MATGDREVSLGDNRVDVDRRSERTGRLPSRSDARAAAGAETPASLPWQTAQLCAAAVLFLGFAALAFRFAYSDALKPQIANVLSNAAVLLAWVSLVAFVYYRCADVVCQIAAKSARLMSRHARGLVLACCLAVAGMVLVTAHITLQLFPNSADEYAFLFQADTFAAKRLWNEPPSPPEAFSVSQIVEKDGKWVGKYAPGWPAVIAAFQALGLPAWAVNPIIGIASLLVFYLLCRRLGSRAMALVGVAMLGGNAFFVFNTASYFNHALTLFGGLVFVLFALRFQDDPSWQNGLISGLALGLIGAARHFEAVLFLLPFLVSLAWCYGPRHWRASLWIALGGAPFMIALMAYYGQVTGNPLLPTMTWDDPNDTLQFLAPASDKDGLAQGILTFGARMIQWSEWTSPPMLPLYGLALAIKIYRRDLRFFDWYFPAIIMGYLFYAGYGGQQYGPRYHYAALPFLLLTLLTGTAHILDRAHTARQKAAVFASLAAAFVLMLLYVPLWSVELNRVVTNRQDLYRQVQGQGLANAVVIVADGTSPTRPLGLSVGLTRNGIDLDRSVLYARDLGPARNAALFARYPAREFWSYRRAEGEIEGVLQPYPR